MRLTHVAQLQQQEKEYAQESNLWLDYFTVEVYGDARINLWGYNEKRDCAEAKNNRVRMRLT